MITVPTTDSAIKTNDDAGKTSERKLSSELGIGKNHARVLAAQSVEKERE